MSNSYKVIELKIYSNELKSSYTIDTIGSDKIFFEIPTLTSFCIQGTTNIMPYIYDSNRSTSAESILYGVRLQNSFDIWYTNLFMVISTNGNIFFELSKNLSGIKNLGVMAKNTMTSTCTIRVHVSN